jgi:aspartate aminotransferase
VAGEVEQRTRGPAPAAGVARLGTESAFAVLARAGELERAGHDVVHLAALRDGQTGYGPSAGLPELREVAAAHLAETRGLPIDPARVLVGTGAKPFLFFTVLAVCEPGDEVVYPDPGFPIYESAIRWAGGVPVPLPLREELGFSFSLEDLAARVGPRTKLVILNSPQNPTGGMTPATDLATAAELIAATPAWVLTDEVYSRIAYGGAVASIATVPGMLERTILLDGLSKTYAMTGWRCGYAAVPEALVDPLTRFFVNSTSCVPAFVQRGAIAALTGPQESVTEMVTEFRARRDLVVAGLRALPGVTCAEPGGAFYAFPNVTGVPLPAAVLATRLLEESGVALLDGAAFGAAGAGHLRLSYAASRERLAEGLGRMDAFLRVL